MFYKMSSNVTTDDKTEKALNGEETADSEQPANEGTNEEEEAVINTYYDKTKSFFDNLSCDDLRYLNKSTVQHMCERFSKFTMSL